MHYLLFLSFFYLSFALPAQDIAKVSVLQDSLSHAKNDTDKASILYRISLTYRDSNPKQALTYARKSAALAKKTGNKLLFARAESATGTSYYTLGDYNTALSFYFSSLRLREEIKDMAGMRSSYNNIANIYNIKENYKKALAHYEKALALGTQLKDSSSCSL